MSIYLVQHGRCVSREENQKRPLTPEGVKEVERIAALLKDFGVKVSEVLHSGKLRAKETAEVFVRELCSPENISAVKGLDPNDSVVDFAERLKPESNKMFVGHLPFMEKLVSLLVTGYEHKEPIKFRNGGVVCLDTVDDHWYIKWAVFPDF